MADLMVDAAPLDDNEKLDRLRLARSENIGPVTYRQLIAHYGTAATALEAIPELARRGGRRRALKLRARTTAEEEIEQVAAFGGVHLYWGEAAYPSALAAIEDAPADADGHWTYAALE